ncbi:zinc ribbon domain-containing protein [Acinetobacter sp. WCHA29]|uniref:zinc ribbon domain-containing protein n=1 Tax=Acinetobacter sp. WCHA29 TaxID=2004649 RepID=UPI001D0CF734|nr:zinc ribbon domain-containing protein [Acinetobacter sp. WCHA29]
MSNIIQLSKPCAFCDSRDNVQLFAGLMLCGNCQDNMHRKTKNSWNMNVGR